MPQNMPSWIRSLWPARAKDSISSRSVIRLGWISSRTVIRLRWVAVAGQMMAVLVVSGVMGFPMPLLPVGGAIGLLGLSNLLLWWFTRLNSRLSERAACLIMAFDIGQLLLLCGLTGGLQNPFSLMILAPVTVAATIFSRGTMLLLAVVAILGASLLGFWHLPLPWPGGQGVSLPAPYIHGVWVALCVSLVFIAIYIWLVARDGKLLQAALGATEQALAREQQLSALGALAAAAAHELGSPLATIAVVAKELKRQTTPDDPIADDVELLLSQSARCRAILQSLSQSPEQARLQALPFPALIRQACGGKLAEAPSVEWTILGDNFNPDQGVVPDFVQGSVSLPRSPEPWVYPTSELVQAIGNLAQNASQFASSQVHMLLWWNSEEILVIIRDDGPGFPKLVLDQWGEPYLSTRRGHDGHMGLGIFIAKTLLERGGATLRFRNGPAGGAEVWVRWPRAQLEKEAG